MLTGCEALPKATKVADKTPTPAGIVVSFSKSAREQPVNGRVLLLLAKNKTTDARKYNIFDLAPVYAILVTNLTPGQKVVFSADKFDDPGSLAFPTSLRSLPAGTYYAQAVIDVGDSRGFFSEAPGNLFSQTVPVQLERGLRTSTALIADQIIPADAPPLDTAWVKLVEIRSELLS